MKYDAIVIGGGPNGLVAARALARRRKRVALLEAADDVGGHLRTVEFSPGFRSPLSDDAGWVPPEVARLANLDELQRAGGAVSTTIIGPDRQTLHLPARVAGAVENIRAISRGDADRFSDFAERMTSFASILADLYQLVPPDIDGPLTSFLPMAKVGRRLRGLGRAEMIEFLREMPMPIRDVLDDYFENELLKAALAAGAVRDLRQGPRAGGTTFNFLHYITGAINGSVRGRPWFLSGPDAFTQALSATLRKRKVDVRTGAEVVRITVKDDAVSGVVLANGEELESSVVVSTVDPKRTFLKLLDPVWVDPELLLAVRNIKLRGSTAFVFYAVDRAVDDPSKSFTTSVTLTPSMTALERASDAAKYGELAEEPHVEIFSPTLRWPQLAPEFKHVVTARVHYAPYSINGGWTSSRCDELERRTTRAISRAVPSFEATILHRAVMSPVDVAEKFHVNEGALTHGEMTLDQILFMRPVPGLGGYHTPIAGLFLGGSGCHPGPGVLGGAGLLAAREAIATR